MSLEAASLPIKLRVEVLRARNLAPADTNGRSDPYCVVRVGSNEVRTSVQTATLDPEWLQSMVFFNSDLEPFALLQETTTGAQRKILLLGYLVVEVWDKDIGNPDDFLGRVVLPLSSFPLCPSHLAENSQEKWYPLSRNSAKGEIKGDLQLKIQLEAVESDVELINSDVNRDLTIVTKGLGFQIPVQLLDTQIVDFPGDTEVVEIAFSKVYVELPSAYRSEAMVLLTNYRLIILAVGDIKGSKVHSTTALSMFNTSSDVSMWIALNNIENVEHKPGNTIVRRQAAGGTAENVDSYSVTIQCYDCRTVQLMFIFDSSDKANGITIVRKGEDRPILPKKLVKQVSEFEKQLRIKKNEVKLKKRLRQLREAFPSKGTRKKPQLSPAETRRRSAAFSVEGDILLPHERGGEGQNLEEEFEYLDEDDLEVCLLEDLLSLKHSKDYQLKSVSEQEADSHVTVEDIDEDPIGLDFLKKPNLSELEAAYQGLTLPTPTRQLISQLIWRLEDIVYNIVQSPPAFTFTRCGVSRPARMTNDWNVEIDLHIDMTRMMTDSWRECKLNYEEQYRLCPTYPPVMYVPATADDDLIVEVAKFRSKGRIPSLVWMDKASGTFLLRSAQPLPGLSDKHSIEDEKLIEYANLCGSSDGEGLTIFDARSSSAATGNKIMGKGTEDVSRYNNCTLTHLDIPNIHAVRESYDSLRQLALSTASSKWFSNLESTQWLQFISLILKGAFLISRLIKIQSTSALIHCSDGWDRTSQLTSLTQIIIDPHYRTIDGFMTLIAKEWLSYGHKFRERIGDPVHPNERSPIFLQFLDCVHQIMNQYPHAFQFNLSYLLCIAEHLNTAWFGTFLYNCHRERVNNEVFNNTLHLMSHFNAIRDIYTNQNYKETKDLLLPSWTVRRLRLWEEYFLAWDGTSITSHAETDLAIEGQDVTNQSSADRKKSSETVVWMSDDKTKACLHCHRKFAILRRKHHCRKCGRIFCDECSKNHASLPSLGYTEPVRVCNECYREITSTQNIEQYSEGEFQVIEHKS